jgi:hypothetical protein
MEYISCSLVGSEGKPFESHGKSSMAVPDHKVFLYMQTYLQTVLWKTLKKKVTDIPQPTFEKLGIFYCIGTR